MSSHIELYLWVEPGDETRCASLDAYFQQHFREPIGRYCLRTGCGVLKSIRVTRQWHRRGLWLVMVRADLAAGPFDFSALKASLSAEQWPELAETRPPSRADEDQPDPIAPAEAAAPTTDMLQEAML